MNEKNVKNNVTIALNALYAKKEKIYPVYVSKHNSNHEKQVIILMIPNRERRKAKAEGPKDKSNRREAKSKRRGRNYLEVNKVSALLSATTSKHPGNFYYLNCLYSFTIKKISRIKTYVKINIFAI